MALHRGTTRVLFIGMVMFALLTVYVLVVTHHLTLPSIHLTHHASGSTRTTQLPKISAKDFAKFDLDKDGHLSVEEFGLLVNKLGHVEISSSSGGGTATEQKQQQETAGDAGDSNAEEEEEEKGGDGDTARPEYGDQQEDDSSGADGAGGDKEAEVQQEEEQQQQRKEEVASSPPPSPLPPPAPSPPLPSPKQSPKDDKPKEQQQQAVIASEKLGQCAELSEDLVRAYAKQNTIMLTVSDWRIFETFGINWMKHLAALNVDYYLVGATDAKTAEFMAGHGAAHDGRHPCFKFFEEGAQGGTSEYKYGDGHYNAATWRKVTVVSKIVAWGFNVLHSDVDVVWFRDPLPYVLGPHLQGVDWVVSTDLISTGNADADDGLETQIHQHVNVNTGVYIAKSTPGGKRFMEGWAKLRETHGNDNDQFGVYKFIRGMPARVEDRTLVLQPDSGAPMRIGFFSVAVLLNGYSYFIPRLNKAKHIPELALHLTWVPLSREGKFHRMRDGMLYHDPPEYYSGPKYLTADIDFPDTPDNYNAWRDTEAMIKYHLGAMDYQNRQMYRVMAVAVILNRTLILPRMQCFCNKNWFMSEQCRIPGDHVTQFPMDCTLDQTLRPKVIYNYGTIEAADFPRKFTFREYSLLDNPRMPKRINDTAVLVVPTGTDFLPEPGKIEVVPKKLRQSDLVKALDKYKDVQLIRLKHASDIFGGFDDAKLKESFELFLEKVTANWCCRDEPYIKAGMNKKEKLAIQW